MKYERCCAVWKMKGEVRMMQDVSMKDAMCIMEDAR